MCVEVSHLHEDTCTFDAAEAGSFAAAGVRMALSLDDIAVSEEVDGLMAAMVTRLGGSVAEVSIIVHRDRVDLVAASGGGVEFDATSGAAAFRTSVMCMESEGRGRAG